jgi:hypothetical protein
MRGERERVREISASLIRRGVDNHRSFGSVWAPGDPEEN